MRRSAQIIDTGKRFRRHRNAELSIAAFALGSPPTTKQKRPGGFRLTGRMNIGRGGGIRTRDLLVPNQLRYQAALRPD